LRLVTLFAAFVLIAVSARAQTPPPGLDPAIAAEVSQAQSDLRAALPGRHASALTDDELKAKLAALPAVRAKLADALTALTPRLQDIEARLAQLGPPPAAGQPPEPAATAASRQGLTRIHQTVDGEVKLARLLSLEADQTSRSLVEQLHSNFADRLWTRSRSILDPGLWTDLSQSLSDDLGRLADVANDEGKQFAEASSRRGRPLIMILGLLAGLALLGPARFLLGRLGMRRAARSASGSRLTRSGLALWLVLVAMLTPFLGGLVIRGALLGAGALTDDFDELVRLAIRAVIFASVLAGLGRALLSPGRPAWRLAPISDEAAARVAPYPGLVGLAAGLTGLVAGVNTAIGVSLATSVASDCASVLIELVVTGAALLVMARIRGTAPAAPKDPPQSRLPWILAALGAWLSLGAVLVAVLAGYLALATFLMRETIWIAAVLATAFLTVSFTDDFFPALLSDKSALGRMVRGAIGISESAMEQIAVLASGACRLVLLALCLAAVLAPFGAGVGDVAGRLAQARFALKIGQVTVSPGLVLGGVGLFLAGLFVTRAVRAWLEARYLPKTNMDAGVRNSVAVGVSYLGALLAAVLAFAYLGLSFSQIALFASALSVGIGFGLQAIIGNFVSGIILLAERPIKVGDWIAIGDLEGDVKAINIRATEIEMTDRSRLIVPNSDLVSKTVRNVTHSDGALGRVRIVLRVDDAADPAEVRDLILTRLKAHADVLSDPPPGVYLTDVRDGALEFTAFAYVGSARYAFRVKSELLFKIVPDLKAHGVVLASTTTVVNVGLSDRPIEPSTTTA